MPRLARFDTPASVRDVPQNSPFYQTWSDWISGQIGGTSPGDGGGAFYDPTQLAVDVAGAKALTWIGFPRDTILPNNRDNRIPAFQTADANPATREDQNEYFEWRVDKNPTGKITKLTFVTEMPEYYEQLWRIDPDAVVRIYQQLVDPAVTRASLENNGTYNKFNDWNTTKGIVHYIQSINTLFAAINLAKGSVTSPPPFGDNFEATPGLSTALTAVDPRVSHDVHMLVRKGLHVTLQDPIGLYIVAWNDAGISHPDGSPAGNYWRIVRGRPGMVMRLEYEVPANLGFVVGDMKIGGRPIEFGGQLAEHITVALGGTAGVPERAMV